MHNKISKTTEKSTNFSNSLTKKTKTQRLITSQLANVNSYKHFLSVPHTGPKYIQWAFGLRSSINSKSQKITAAPPQTYYKKTQSQKYKHTSADFSTGVNISQFSHLTMHRVGQHPSNGQLNFQTTLRMHQNKTDAQKILQQRQKKWCTIPRRDRREDPVFIRSKSLKKKICQNEQLETACDGRQNYPKFTQKIIKTRNVNQYRHLIKGSVNLPSIGWQADLRSY